jgi:RNA polymerase sigma factor (sigma-70 family)
MRKRIIVDLIDDDEAVLDALAMYLESKAFVVRRHRSADDFLRGRDRVAHADCIVADVRMPRMTGLDLQRHLNKRKAKEALILITGFANIDAAVSAIKAGAVDFLEKPISEQRLVASIKSAVRQAERQQAEESEHLQAAALVAKLSVREREVLDLAARGLTSREIAAELGISPRTVEVHRAAMMHKTGASNIADLVRLALRNAGV